MLDPLAALTTAMVCWAAFLFPRLLMSWARSALTGWDHESWVDVASLTSRIRGIRRLSTSCALAVALVFAFGHLLSPPSTGSLAARMAAIAGVAFLPAVGGAWLSERTGRQFLEELLGVPAREGTIRYRLALRLQEGASALAILATVAATWIWGLPAILLPILLVPLLAWLQGSFFLLTRCAREIEGSCAGAIRSRMKDLGIRRPRVMVLDTGSEYVWNAFAVPSKGWILLTQDLLQSLSHEEILAVAEHEIGHLMERRWLWLRCLPTLLWLESIPVLSKGVPGLSPGQVFLWVAALYFLARAGTRRISRWLEGRADQRCLAVPGTIAAALIKIHRLGLQPTDSGWLGTHPGLRSRLREAGMEEAPRGARVNRSKLRDVEKAVVAPFVVLVALPTLIYCVVRLVALLSNWTGPRV